jgi:hypothetical protein
MRNFYFTPSPKAAVGVAKNVGMTLNGVTNAFRMSTTLDEAAVMTSLFLMMPPSWFAEKAIAALIGYGLFLFLIVRGSQFSSWLAFVVGPVATLLFTAAYHFVQGRYGSGDLGYSFLIGIMCAAVIGGYSTKRSPTDRRLPDTLGWVSAALVATVIVIAALYAVWYALASPIARQLDAGDMFVNFLRVGLLAGLPVTLTLFVLFLVRSAKK